MVRIIEDEVEEDPVIFSQENAASLFRRASPAAWRPIPSLPCIYSGFHLYIFRFPGVRHGSNGFSALLLHFTRLCASEGCFKSVLSFHLHFTRFYKHRMFQVGSLWAKDVLSKRWLFVRTIMWCLAAKLRVVSCALVLVSIHCVAWSQDPTTKFFCNKFIKNFGEVAFLQRKW